LIGLAFAVFLATLTALGALALSSRLGTAALWAWSWVLVFGGAVVLYVQGQLPLTAPLFFVFALSFPVVLWLGACAYLGERAPRWPLAAAVAIGAGLAALDGAGFTHLAHGVAGAAAACGIAIAAWTTRPARARPVSARAVGTPAVGALSERALPWVLAALALWALVTPIALAAGYPIAVVTGWLVVGSTAGMAQMSALAARTDASRRSHMEGRKAAEATLYESEERFRAITENVQDMVAELDAQGRILYLSPRHAEVLGEEIEELAGRSALEFYDANHRDDVRGAFQEVLEGGSPPPSVWRWAGPRGHTRWFETVMRAFRTRAGEPRVVICTRDVTDRERLQERLRGAREQLEARVADRTQALAAANVDLAAEIDERRQAEQENRALALRMRESQRQQSLGLLAGGVAHDFNNLLLPILGQSTLALEELPDDSPVAVRLERIQRAAGYAAELVRKMLTYSGRASMSLETLEISELVAELTGLLDTTVAEHGRLETELPPDLPPTRGDPTQIRQVVMNLITNAAESLGDAGGTVRVRTGLIDVGQELLTSAISGGDLEPGPYLLLEVADTGCGLDADARERIFDPFFTTKFSGRGLGLAAVLGIVRGHRGAILLESEPGRGTRIQVLLPVTGGAETRPDPATQTPLPSRLVRVLVVDDDEPVRELAQEYLERAGMAVHGASGGAEALELLRKEAPEIDVVILDLRMPGLDGIQVLEQIRRDHADLPVVLASGHSRAESAERAGQLAPAGYLEKPYTPEELVEAVSRALAPPDA